VKELLPASFRVIPDRIEAATYLRAGITGGNLRVTGCRPDHLKAVLQKLEMAGVNIEVSGDSVRAGRTGDIRSINLKTWPYPGFPTDMQAQFMALMSVAKGSSVINGTVFENRFMHVDELKRMGASIKIDGRIAMVEGVARLAGCPVTATDLRAGAALVVAALSAEGRTEIGSVHHIDRGYDRIVDKLKGLGADISRHGDE